jgi:V/A-type H+-transporting ATPase subunit F
MTFFVLGDEDVILGFQFVGIKGKIIENNEDAIQEFDNAINGSYGNVGVLLVTEKVASMIEEKLMDWQLSGNYPLIVEIPDMEGHLEGKKTMLDSIREAIGIQV